MVLPVSCMGWRRRSVPLCAGALTSSGHHRLVFFFFANRNLKQNPRRCSQAHTPARQCFWRCLPFFFNGVAVHKHPPLATVCAPRPRRNTGNET